MTHPLRHADRGVSGFTAEEFRRALDRAAELAEAYLKSLPARPAFRRVPDDVVDRIAHAPLPRTADSADRILTDIERDILPYALGIGHPRWWGFVRASADPLGATTDLLAGVMNNNCVGGAQVATYVETTVIRWLAELVGYGSGPTGILTSGGSAANFVALTAMREAKLPGCRQAGLIGSDRAPVIYVSGETHSCIRRAVEYLGFGSRSLNVVAVDDEFRMDPIALARAIASDRLAGRYPLCIVATAGTVNTGIVDPLDQIADIAERENLWFHVDGAYGAVGAALPERAERYRGMHRADSLVLDPHKWLFVPYEAGAVLVRDVPALQRAFATDADYLDVRDGDYFNGPLWYHEQGPQLSRGFRALKVWAVMRHIGVEGYRELWRRDIATAQEIDRLVRSHARLEPMAVSDLSVCCFRYRPRGGDPDAFNRALVDRIQRDGRAFVSGTVLNGSFVLRACVINFRSGPDDARVLLDAVTELGAALERERDP